MKPWIVVETVATPEGELQLRQRGDDALITIAGRVLMTSHDRRSEEALATLGCAAVRSKSPRVMIGGLGMGYTLRAALDALPATARVTMVELNAVVARWCQGPLAALTNQAALDPRAQIVIDDVAHAIATAPAASFDAILLDLYEGPNSSRRQDADPFYGHDALARSHAALADDGVLGVWSEDPDPAFERRVRAARFDLTIHRSGTHRSHVVYMARRLGGRSRT